jgi:hypothetical protein
VTPFFFRAREILRWLFWDTCAFWSALLGSLAALAASMLFPWPAERQVRLAGFIVTLFGVVLVAREITETAKLFKRPTLRSRVKAWGARLPAVLGRRSQVRAAGVAVMPSLTASGRATVRHNPSDPDSWRSWVDALWRNSALIEERITQETAQLERQISGLQGALKSEAQRREEEIRAINQRVEHISAGGLDWAIVGAVWVVVGQFYGSFPQEIANLFARMP